MSEPLKQEVCEVICCCPGSYYGQASGNASGTNEETKWEVS